MLAKGDQCGARLLYQGDKYRAALKHTGVKRRVAIDVGAHVGLWSWLMAKDFSDVMAFEPMPEHAECWRLNMMDSKACLIQTALGRENGRVNMITRTPGSSGDTNIAVAADGPQRTPDAMITTLDSYHLDYVDFIKADCEGFELFVMQGAEETLKRCRPCVIVEQKGKPGMSDRYGLGPTEAVEYLQSLGAVLRNTIMGDYILSWND